MTPQEVLDLKLPEGHESGAATLREFFVALAERVWMYGEEFSGKRPFGNSGWHWDVYDVLVRAGLTGGIRDTDGALDSLADFAAADRIVQSAIRALAERGE